MMKRFGTILVGALAAFGFASSAQGAATVDLIWTSTSGTGTTGGTAINAAYCDVCMQGDTLTLDVLLTAGTEGLSSWGISIAFDADLKDELNLVGTPSEFGIMPTVTCVPFPTCFFGSPTVTPLSPGVAGTVESTTTRTGFVFTFEAATLGSGVSASFGQFRIGEIVFEVNSSVAMDGVDVQSGFFNPGVDGVFTNAGTPAMVNFNGAAVNGPEPGTTLLLGLGLLGLTIAGRRARRP